MKTMILNQLLVHSKLAKGLMIKGQTQEKSVIRGGVVVTLVDKKNPSQTAVKASDYLGNFCFPRLKPGTYLLLAADSKKLFNAVVQDNLVPKI